MTNHYTIGMAGHIDHGKTTLTKALTGVDTDRLKEEKERQISIELGYAPLQMEDGSILSIIDVPGHERFIRQMIAGVAGIDLVILVVAADEGVMPQTKEHLEILKFLQIKKGIIAITKKDKVEEELLELVEEEILDELEGTIFQDAPVVFLNSIKKDGMEELKQVIINELKNLQVKHEVGNFRLPIDQVFSLKGQGTVVRGTIMEGVIQNDETLEVLPSGLLVKARQLQVHNAKVQKAKAGQRVAVNLPNISTTEIKRGDVLVHSHTYETTDTIDVSLQFVKKLQHPIKQRSLIKVHIGTAEVLGRIVFFDRNEYEGEYSEEVLCQIRLEDEITAKRGDKFIIRRPTPVETVGGGWIIQAKGSKYKFGKETLHRLQKVKEGIPEQRVKQALAKHYLLEIKGIQAETGLTNKEMESLIEYGKIIQIKKGQFTGSDIVLDLKERLINYILSFHQTYPLKAGVSKAELLSSLMNSFPSDLVEYVIEILQEEGIIQRRESLINSVEFKPHFPKAWKKRMEQVVSRLESDGLTPKLFVEYGREAGLPEKELHELRYYLIYQKEAYELSDKHLISVKNLVDSVGTLKKKYPQELALGQVKDELGMSRKYLIPYVELLDSLGITQRIDKKRYWT
ncbi:MULTISPECIES: selenocysteine-specific translation elongation factor [unclassified Sutcliffiella]|uniref:selenocysteine-specific translation elongation factor n=1 Tax=Sutcliffiella sp. BMC8 TaxID=3073243 RepID=UPI0030D3F12B